MQITAEYLNEQRKGLEAQRLNALAIVNQTAGAMATIDVMLKRLQEPEPEKESE
jgi:hypothetical protein